MARLGEVHMAQDTAPADGGSQLLYGIDDEPPLFESLTLGFQHYLTMFGSTVAIPLLLKDALGIGDDAVALGKLISTMFFVSGITTILQVQFGNRLPIIQGGTFSFLTPAFAICGMAALNNVGWEVRMQHIQGAVIAGSLFEIVLGATGLVGRLLRFVGPITIAPTIALIGLSAPTGLRSAWTSAPPSMSCLIAAGSVSYFAAAARSGEALSIIAASRLHSASE